MIPIGIVDYGFYIPEYRLKVEEIAKFWGRNPDEIKDSLIIFEKSVASDDEDSLTMAFEASQMALSSFGKKDKIKIIFFGSETPPYAVNPVSTTLAEFLGIEGNYLALDHQFACKAATGAIISALGLIKAKFSEFALICASDKAITKIQDPLEYTGSSGAAAFLFGREDLIVEVIDFESFSSDTPDFWRREGIKYPSHGGRFTGKPSYFYHIESVSKIILKKNSLQPKDFAYAVFHMPNGRFPQIVAKNLGFNPDQIEPGLVVKILGNSYTASSLLGLISILQLAKPGDLIFFASYGSGAGSDAFIFKVTPKINGKRKNFWDMVNRKKYINYPTYLKFLGLI